LTFNFAFWLSLYSEDHTLPPLLSRVLQFAVNRISDRAQAYRKKLGVQFFLDKLREMYEESSQASLDEFGSAVVDKVKSSFIVSLL
jgi:hypothetical protein